MDVQLEKRLIELRAEYENGQKFLKDIELKLAELENRKKILGETLLRISGAIELLEELLGESAGVQGQEIKAGSITPEGDIEVPNVIRQPIEKARKTLEEAGLSAGEVTEQKGILPIGVIVGEVLRQNPKPGTKLPAGSAVNLVVASKGKFLPPDRKSSCRSFSDRG
ncbi:PASTA domain-containing protein [Methanosarcina sp.]|uniref:PASTA domain-containing protein n=1 Tax=Methanosarcina sp. TaxID=2213 RepID=UPI002CFCB8BD|nr:PASTA domain-containing protein [Methanosarcina sp.]HOW13761.1 PASTA domain-containing protein [Methanosarcina sp.]